MNHETTIQKIQELVPDVMKLEFGCEIFREGASREIFISRFGNEYSVCKLNNNGLFSPMTLPFPPKSQIFEILGKPITLSHILLASKGVMIDTVGIFYDVKTLKPLNIGCAWNLSQNYDGQSEKTKDIIDKIVV